jgi:hypothetical protein
MQQPVVPKLLVESNAKAFNIKTDYSRYWQDENL